ncbi:MAG: choice-of-anchor Q domain-containing protein [Planctomycetota bacterium]
MPRSITLDRQGCPAWSGRRIMQFMALAMCAALLDARITRAREWYVSKTGSNADGQSWATAYNHPQDAIDAAFADGGGEVWVKADTYVPTGDGDRTKSFVMRDGVDMYGGFAGTETLRSQRNYATNVTILSGDLNGDDDPSRTLDAPARNNSENSYHVVVGAEGATLDGFTVKAGAANVGPPNGYGGGVNTNASVTIVNCTFSGNYAGSRGGAIYILDASPTITDCVMSQNSAIYGGGIYCVGATSSPTITGCAFSGNTAEVHGAGIYVDGPSSPATIADCVFSWNASGGNGGGLYADDSALAVVGCTFTGNTATACGGAVYDYGAGSSPVITGCVLSGNTADWGGGMFSAGISPSVTNCTFSGNTAARDGGGVYCSSSTALTLSNCIVWDNRAPTGPQLMDSGTPSCTVMNTDIGQSGGFLDGGGNIDSCPLFVDANGPDDIVGTTDDDLRLRAGSPCIDAGWGDNYVFVPSTDLDGNPRHDDTGTPDTGTGTPTFVDMGSFEYQGTTPPAWMTVWAPSAGVAMQPGADAEIRWSSSGSIAGVTIELSRNGGTDWEEIAASTPNDGSHVWTVTDGGQPLPQQNCVVRVSDAADGDPTGLSDVFAVFDGTWYVDADAPGPVFDGLSWSTAFLHPQQAVVLAETGQEVLVAEGTYLPRALIATANPRRLSFELAGGVAVYGGYAGYGEPDPDDRDPVAHATVLSGDLGMNGDPADNSYHVVKGASAATLDGFTVTGGNADGSDPDDHGGGMFNLGVADLTVANCVFADNLADDDGGALLNEDVTGLAVSGCVFSGNRSGDNGGGIHNLNCSAISIADCEFTGNTGYYSGGGDVRPALVADVDELPVRRQRRGAQRRWRRVYGRLLRHGLLRLQVSAQYGGPVWRRDV